MAGTITALRFQKRTAERVNVYLDDQYAFAVPALVAAALRRGQYLTDADIARLRDQDQEQKAYDRALRLLGRRPRSIAEIKRYLQGHEFSEATCEAVIQRLKAAEYLDDEVFARLWVADRERFRPRGEVALRHELRQKGIAGDIIDNALEDVDGESNAYRAAETQARRLAGLDARTFRQKLGNFLLRRGFSHDTVWPVVAQLWQDQQAGNDKLDEPS